MSLGFSQLHPANTRKLLDNPEIVNEGAAAGAGERGGSGQAFPGGAGNRHRREPFPIIAEAGHVGAVFHENVGAAKLGHVREVDN